MRKWTRRRISAWAGVVVLGVWIPVALAQNYFRYNAWILPVTGLVAVVFYFVLWVSTPSISAKLHSFHQGFGTVNPLGYLAIVAIIGGLLLLVLVIGEWYALQKSSQHVAELRIADLSKTTATTPIPAPVAPAQQKETADHTVKQMRKPSPKAASSKQNISAPPPSRSQTGEPSIPHAGVLQAPCSVFQNGGTGNTANPNCGPPEPIVHWSAVDRDKLKDAKHPQTFLDVYVDRSFPDAKFAVTCDQPCDGAGAAVNVGGYSQADWGKIDGDHPNIAVFIINGPNPMPSYKHLELVVESRSYKPVRVLSVDRLTLGVQTPQ